MTEPTIHFGHTPASPPPDPNQPWLWTGDRWLLLATDDDGDEATDPGQTPD